MFHESMSLKKNQMGMDPIKSPPRDPFNTIMMKSLESLTGFHAWVGAWNKTPLLLSNDFCHYVGWILLSFSLAYLLVSGSLEQNSSFYFQMTFVIMSVGFF